MPLATFLINLVKPFIYQGLVYLGISLVTYTGVSIGVDSYLSQAKAAYLSADARVLAYLAMAGVPDFLGLIAAGISIRVAHMSSKKFRVK